MAKAVDSNKEHLQNIEERMGKQQASTYTLSGRNMQAGFWLGGVPCMTLMRRLPEAIRASADRTLTFKALTDVPLSFDLGAQGYAEKREWVIGSLQAK
jgi:hypothetical protein